MNVTKEEMITAFEKLTAERDALAAKLAEATRRAETTEGFNNDLIAGLNRLYRAVGDTSEDSPCIEGLIAKIVRPLIKRAALASPAPQSEAPEPKEHTKDCLIQYLMDRDAGERVRCTCVEPQSPGGGDAGGRK